MLPIYFSFIGAGVSLLRVETIMTFEVDIILVFLSGHHDSRTQLAEGADVGRWKLVDFYCDSWNNCAPSVYSAFV